MKHCITAISAGIPCGAHRRVKAQTFRVIAPNLNPENVNK